MTGCLDREIRATAPFTGHEIWLLQQWYAAAAAESCREWDAEAQAIFLKLGVTEEPVI